MNISSSIIYIGVDDVNLDLFENQYPTPDGISYNSYVILDDKIAIMDTVDARKVDEWFNKLTETLKGRDPDYLVVHHMEPDHSSGIVKLLDRYPNIKVVGNSKTFNMMEMFFNVDDKINKVIVKEDDILDLGKHSLTFLMAWEA